MTGLELRHLIAKLGLTQTGTARLIGVDPRAIRHWIADDNRIPQSVALLLQACDRFPSVLEWLRDR